MYPQIQSNLPFANTKVISKKIKIMKIIDRANLFFMAWISLISDADLPSSKHPKHPKHPKLNRWPETEPSPQRNVPHAMSLMAMAFADRGNTLPSPSPIHTGMGDHVSG